ncbi:uncharacterized protein LOC100678079 [Nasonia vitripennis]|uniref:Uncharacterized protein n=1 Tax=Nasonia vitripennis TaxID=7425 RepID=A0A7M7GBE6_NASVI|nr:uncharacterized protein LOC100678079 [Nasonia vitripennis]
MVADNSLPEKSSIDHSLGENVSKIISNFDVSQSSSSSDESSKSRLDNDSRKDKSYDTSAKDESNDENRQLNNTYLCYKSDAQGDFVENAALEKEEEAKDLITSIMSKRSSPAKSTPRKRRNVFSLTSDFDECDWNSELGSKIETLTVDESRLADHDTDESLFVRIRNYLAEYQELRGTSREEYTFSTLIKVMGQATGRCLFALFYVFLNIAPVLEVFLHILRFILDKVIDIKSTTDVQQFIVKNAIFVFQLASIYVCLIFIFGFIISPFIRMAFGILLKIMLYD